MDGDQFSDPSRGGGAGIRGGLHGPDVTAHHDGDVSGANVLLPINDTVAAFTIASAASMIR